MIGPGHIASTDGYAYKLLFLIFYHAQLYNATARHSCRRCAVYVRPSVRLSVCLSHASTDSKLTTAASCGFYHWAEGL